MSRKQPTPKPEGLVKPAPPPAPPGRNNPPSTPRPDPPPAPPCSGRHRPQDQEFWGIAANVIQDRVLRTGAKVKILHIDGDGGENPVVYGQSKGGCTLAKRIAAKRLCNYRPVCLFPGKVKVDSEVRWKFPTEEDAAKDATRWQDHWAHVRFVDHATGEMTKGVSVNQAFSMEDQAKGSQRLKDIAITVSEQHADMSRIIKQAYLAGVTDTLEAQAVAKAKDQEVGPHLKHFDAPNLYAEAYAEGFKSGMLKLPGSMNPYKGSGHERDTTPDDDRRYQWERGHDDGWVQQKEDSA